MIALDVVIVGIDTNIYLHSPDIDWVMAANVTDTIDSVGQAGKYTTRSFHTRGYNTAFIGYVGNNMGGPLIRTAHSLQ